MCRFPEARSSVFYWIRPICGGFACRFVSVVSSYSALGLSADSKCFTHWYVRYVLYWYRWHANDAHSASGPQFQGNAKNRLIVRGLNHIHEIVRPQNRILIPDPCSEAFDFLVDLLNPLRLLSDGLPSLGCESWKKNICGQILTYPILFSLRLLSFADEAALV